MNHWFVNLRPKQSDTPALVVPIARKTASGSPEREAHDLLEWARQKWPGQVLDVVDPDGRSFLLCSIPPWEQKALPPSK